MRLVISPPEINHETPFDESDLLFRKSLADRLCNLVREVEDGFVMAINAPWGTGKTFFIKRWLHLLDNQGNGSFNNSGVLTEHVADSPHSGKGKTIYFDAFENDYGDDAFVALVSQVSSLITKQENDLPPDKVTKFRNIAVKMGKRICFLGAKSAISYASAGLIDYSALEGGVKKIAEEISTGILGDTSKSIEKKLSTEGQVSAPEETDTIVSFRNALGDIAKEIRKKTGHPLIFVIDELDRCKPTYALDVIERIKHFFSVENMVFVLVLNKKQLEESVKCVYGNEIKADIYLQKFIHVEIDLPVNAINSNFAESGYRKFCLHLLEAHGLKQEHNIINTFVILAEYYSLSLRDLERNYTSLTLFAASAPKNYPIAWDIVVFLIFLKFKFPEAYTKLKNKRVTTTNFSEFKQSAELDTFKTFIDERTNNLATLLLIEIRLCVSNSKEINSLLESEVGQKAYSFVCEAIEKNGKTKVIPRYCEQIDYFKFPN